MSSTTKKKFVEKELSDDYTLPTDNQMIVKIIKPKGNNLHQIITSTGEEYLASMPPKFRKTIWVKRGDYVVAEPIPEGQKVKFEIVRILSKDHVKYYISQNVWPGTFADSNLYFSKSGLNAVSDSDSEDSDLLMCNPNKLIVTIDSEESSSESDDINIDHNDKISG